ncbi:MAG: endolytic transglycosylase MltG [Elusimicrobia bacterium]|nr:endolytic transglycosylase MltG [Elusimicrobiota bacterium]
MRKLIAAALLGLLVFGAWLLYPSPGGPVEVTVPPGLSAWQTAQLLKEKGVLRSARLFKLAAALTKTDRRLKPGTYELRRSMPATKVLRILASGAARKELKVVIPEGFSARQIAERLEAEGVCPAQAFLKEAQVHRLEGYLFPATYSFEPGTAAAAAAQRMHQEFKSQILRHFEAAEPKPALNLHQLVTLASIVEREAVLPREKPMIAAVYLNRMQRRMRLEADPTVQYALRHWKKGLTTEDLRTPSPYNTYMHYGLPPGPICSPGLDSFKAAMRPAETDAVYFVADNTGGHVFSATHEEHIKAKQSFKRGLRALRERLKRGYGGGQ